MEYGSEIDMKIFNGGVYLERSLAASFLSLLSFASVLSQKHARASLRSACAGL